MIETNEIEKKNLAVVERAKSYEIKTADDYASAMSYAVEIKKWKKSVNDLFDPQIESARSAWKESIALRDRFLTPLDEALSLIDQRGRAYRADQERIRAEAEREAREKQERERQRLEALAKKAEERGDEKKAAKFLARAYEALIGQISVNNNIPKIDGVKIRKIWKARVTDLSALIRAVSDGKAPANLVIENSVALKSLATATKGTLSVPGVVFFSEDAKI